MVADEPSLRGATLVAAPLFGAAEVVVEVDFAAAVLLRATLTVVGGTVLGIMLVVRSAESTIRDDHCCGAGLDVDGALDVVWASTAADPMIMMPIQMAATLIT